jgi:hypothetical protein
MSRLLKPGRAIEFPTRDEPSKSSFKLDASRNAFPGKGLLRGVIIASILLAFLKLPTSWFHGLADSILELEPTPAPSVEGLVYLETDYPSGSLDLRILPSSSTSASPDREAQSYARLSVQLGCEVRGIHASPHGPWIVIQWSCEDGARIEVVNGRSGNPVPLSSDVRSDTIFLYWHPRKNEILLKIHASTDPQIASLAVPSGRLSGSRLPTNTYAAAYHRSGAQLAFATYSGFGQGSELWLADKTGEHKQLIKQFPSQIVGMLQWSDQDDKLAYILLPDSVQPFSTGELWVVNADGSEARFLTAADAGHGFPIFWSTDGSHVFYIRRENPDDLGADIDPKALLSNLYQVEVMRGIPTPLTTLEDAIVADPSRSPNGQFIAFTVIRNQKAELWQFDLNSKSAELLQRTNAPRHPAWVQSE